MPPLLLELGWGEVAQRGVDALVQVHLVKEATQLMENIIIVLIVRQVKFSHFG